LEYLASQSGTQHIAATPKQEAVPRPLLVQQAMQV
jgi:hypothetical protein